MFQSIKQAIKHAVLSITRPQLPNDDDDKEIYYPASSLPEFPPGHPLSMTPFPPGMKPFTYPVPKNHLLTYPPKAPVPVLVKTTDLIESERFSLPHTPAQLSVPSDFSIKTCQVHSIPDLLGLHSPSTACAFQPQLPASTRHRTTFPPRVKKRLASVRCIQLSPAQAKVKKRLYDAINMDESNYSAVQDSAIMRYSVVTDFAVQDSAVQDSAILNYSAVQDSAVQASVDLDYELPEFLILKEKLVLVKQSTYLSYL